MSFRSFRRLVFFLLAAAALASHSAEAVPLGYSFTAVVLDTSDAPADLQPGAAITGSVVYDTAATSNGQTMSNGGTTESYTVALPAGTPLVSITFESSATAVSDTSGIAIVRDFPDGTLFTDGFVVQGGSVASPYLISFLQLNLTATNNPTGPISDTVLAPDLPLLGWGISREVNFFTGYNSTLPSGRIRADITSIQSMTLAPEPSAAVLLGVGLGLLAIRRRTPA